MIDIKLVRENKETIKELLAKRLCDLSIDELYDYDLEWKKTQVLEQELRARRNTITEDIKVAKSKGQPIEGLLKEAKELPTKIKEAGDKTTEILEKRNYLLERLPNLPDKTTPDGPEENFKIVKNWGEKLVFDFKPKLHYEVASTLGILDIPRAVKISGAGFYIFKKDLARLERALINFFLDTHKSNGLTELNMPFMVNQKTAYGTGNLPKFEQDLYKTTNGFYLIPTAEVPVTNIYAEETLEAKDLPQKFCAYTPCFRTEAGRHGSETPGIFRLHQFDKVEMVYLCKQEESWDLHEKMRRDGEEILEKLGLAYRTKLLAAGDMGIASAKTYDLEVYAPAMDKYLETSSISNCTDYQARRMNTKYKEGNETKLVHTLNGSGLATPRLLIALIETYQTKEGHIKIPKVLQKYMGGQEIIK